MQRVTFTTSQHEWQRQSNGWALPPFMLCEVASLVRGKEHAHVNLLRDGVHSEMLLDGVVICAGTASRAFAAALGDRVNIYPVKGYSITVNLNDSNSQASAPQVSLLDDATKIVSNRLGAKRFRVAGAPEFNGFNRDIRADRIRPLIRWVEQCFHGVNTRDVIPWAGLRPMMPNMLPHVGRGKHPRVFYNTGHGHLGWTLSAATADLIGTIVAGQRANPR
jgi:D-amino-acid dehydrogenase